MPTHDYPNILRPFFLGHQARVDIPDVPLSHVDSLASAFALFLQPGDWIFLEGELGAGKTQWTQSLCLALGEEGATTSPTFSLVHNISLQAPQAKKLGIEHVIHMDLYRLRKENELYFLGLEDGFVPLCTVVILEWASLVSDGGWDSFFATTGCPRPRRCWGVDIAYGDNAKEPQQRHYTVRWLGMPK